MKLPAFFLSTLLLCVGIFCLNGIDLPHFKKAFADGVSAPIAVSPVGQSTAAVNFPPQSGGGSTVTFDTLSWAALNGGVLSGSGCGATGASYNAGSSTLTWTHPGAASGVTAAILFIRYYTGAGALLNAATYNSVSMPSPGSPIALPNAANSFVGFNGLGGAASGSNTVSLTFSTSNATGAFGLMTVKGSVTTSNPFRSASYTTNSNATPGTSLSSGTISSATNDLIVDVTNNYDGTNQYTMTPGAGQTMTFYDANACTGSTGPGAGSGSRLAGAASTSTSWTWGTNAEWAIAAVSIQHQ